MTLTPAELRHALLTNAEMAEADRLTIAGGPPGVELMAAAGGAVARVAVERWPEESRRAWILAGPGNNGGDGFVAALDLQRSGRAVRLVLLGERERLEGDAAHFAALWSGPIDPPEAFAPEAGELIVDALFGAGLARPLEGRARSLVERANTSGAPILAVDVPSGLSGDTGSPLGETVIRASATVTFFRAKPGHRLLPGARLCGPVEVHEIGSDPAVLQSIGPSAFDNHPDLWLEAWPPRRPEAHKYDYGHALVVAGPLGGAARLAATAALRVGAGLVTIAAPREAVAIAALASPSVMVREASGPLQILELIERTRVEAVLLGPGAGAGEATAELTTAILGGGRATVLDADALTSFSERPESLFDSIHSKTILTPHEGEFARLFPDLDARAEGAVDKLARAREAAARAGCPVLLKGWDTAIAEPSGRAVLHSGSPPALATAGSGDVLAGLILGLLAQGLRPAEAGAAACWLHARAGETGGPGLISEDLVAALPRVLSDLRA